MTPGKRSGGPWYGEDFSRLCFERMVKQYFPDLIGTTIVSGKDAGRRYRLTVHVPHYEDRRVQILFRKESPKVPRITVDGPVESKHRYGSGELCMWYPYDPKDNRWIIEEGLLVLIGHISAHLFREAWWRETGEWLGPEAGHPTSIPEPEGSKA